MIDMDLKPLLGKLVDVKLANEKESFTKDGRYKTGRLVKIHRDQSGVFMIVNPEVQSWEELSTIKPDDSFIWGAWIDLRDVKTLEVV